jgi:hypothetical protein
MLHRNENIKYLLSLLALKQRFFRENKRASTCRNTAGLQADSSREVIGSKYSNTIVDHV